jgi:hypothetical protein
MRSDFCYTWGDEIVFLQKPSRLKGLLWALDVPLNTCTGVSIMGTSLTDYHLDAGNFGRENLLKGTAAYQDAAPPRMIFHAYRSAAS